MNRSFEEQIRERAYHLWESTGMADGMAHDHWIHAERAVLTERAPNDVKAIEPKPSKSKPSKSKPSKSKSAAGATKAKVAKTGGAKGPVAKVVAMTKKVPATTTRASDLLN